MNQTITQAPEIYRSGLERLPTIVHTCYGELMKVKYSQGGHIKMLYRDILTFSTQLQWLWEKMFWEQKGFWYKSILYIFPHYVLYHWRSSSIKLSLFLQNVNTDHTYKGTTLSDLVWRVREPSVLCDCLKRTHTSMLGYMDFKVNDVWWNSMAPWCVIAFLYGFQSHPNWMTFNAPLPHYCLHICHPPHPQSQWKWSRSNILMKGWFHLYLTSTNTFWERRADRCKCAYLNFWQPTSIFPSVSLVNENTKCISF